MQWFFLNANIYSSKRCTPWKLSLVTSRVKCRQTCVYNDLTYYPRITCHLPVQLLASQSQCTTWESPCLSPSCGRDLSWDTLWRPLHTPRLRSCHSNNFVRIQWSLFISRTFNYPSTNEKYSWILVIPATLLSLLLFFQTVNDEIILLQ